LVTILVNNVGGCPITLPAFRALETYSCEDVDAVINMNARFMARLTALMLPILSRRPRPQERSLILNTSSVGMVGVPWLVMYGATKAFNWSFSQGLARELEADERTRHIDCLAVIPADVRSQGNCHGVPDNAPNSDDFGRCVVEKVDGAVRRREREMIPYWLHDFQANLLDTFPEGLKTSSLTEQMRKKRNDFNDAYEKSR
jgi:17beta-estradiol 17-dehydrogenase / very-long-chain 3-oxoacyl-CoA reductase